MWKFLLKNQRGEHENAAILEQEIIARIRACAISRFRMGADLPVKPFKEEQGCGCGFLLSKTMRIESNRDDGL